ncbi:MAG: NDP-sugar synthase [Desulfobacterota bacterium]|nr:NDP-sugar synthase [Thermodesulfobacteriota bacterium]
MKAIILAAGFGERMQPLSTRCPKPLLPILGRPIIDYIIRQLKDLGIIQIGVNICHLAEKMKNFLGDGSRWGVDITFSPEQEIQGTGGGIRRFFSFLEGEDYFLVYNGDVFARVDLRGLIAEHQRKRSLATLALCNFPPKNNVTCSPEGLITDFLGKLKKFDPQRNLNFTFTGISVVSFEVLKFIPQNIPSNIIETYLQLLEYYPGSIRGYLVSETEWMDIGTPQAYLEVHKKILFDRQPLSIEKIPLGGIYRGEGTTIQPEAKLYGFVSLGNYCVVEKEVFLKNCVVWDNTRVKTGTCLENGVIDGNWLFSLSRGAGTDS